MPEDSAELSEYIEGRKVYNIAQRLDFVNGKINKDGKMF